jgi:hypothetical protein
MYIPLTKALYSLRATSSRIDFIDGLARNLYLETGLGNEYDITVSMIRHCLRIRNLYAHCNWVDDISVSRHPGLFYADLQDAAKTPDLRFDFKHVDVPLLQRQEDYFAETMEWLSFMDHETAVRLQFAQFHVWPRPSELEPPPLHNLASQHIPPWLSEDRQAQHLARALEDEEPPRPPERAPSVLRLTREEWAAKHAKEAREAAARAADPTPAKGNSDPPQE